MELLEAVKYINNKAEESQKVLLSEICIGNNNNNNRRIERQIYDNGNSLALNDEEFEKIFRTTLAKYKQFKRERRFNPGGNRRGIFNKIIHLI